MPRCCCPAAYPSAGDAYRVGITGAPGAGKSTLTDGLIGALRQRGEAVAVLAVDPTSPFTGGAVLGDRVRMQDHVSDAGVYIRSMASRGHLGGLSAAAPKALTAAGCSRVPLAADRDGRRGPGRGRSDRAADTTLVVVTPGWGDGIQAAKAGILEIGDVFVVNKADRVGVKDTVADLRTMLHLGAERCLESSDHRDRRLFRRWDRRCARGDRRAPCPPGIQRWPGARAAGPAGSPSWSRRWPPPIATWRPRRSSRCRAAHLVESVAAGAADPWSAATRMLEAGVPPAR